MTGARARYLLVFGAALLVVASAVAALALALWSDLDAAERVTLRSLIERHVMLLFLAALLLVAALGGLAQPPSWPSRRAWCTA
jgi:hypothetical protein